MISGNIKSFTVAHSIGGSLVANAIGTMKIGGDATNLNVTLGQAFEAGVVSIKSLVINGAVNGLDLTGNSDFGPISVGSLDNSNIFAGLSGGGLPSTSGDFAANAHISSVTVRSRVSGGFQNSDIAAESLGVLKLGSIDTGNGGTDFGVGCHTLGELSATISAGHGITLKGINPGNVAADLAALKVPLGDFKVIAV